MPAAKYDVGSVYHRQMAANAARGDHSEFETYSDIQLAEFILDMVRDPAPWGQKLSRTVTKLIAGSIGVNAMQRDELYQKAHDCASFALEDLQRLHRSADWIEALTIFPLVVKQEAIVTALKEMINAKPR